MVGSVYTFIFVCFFITDSFGQNVPFTGFELSNYEAGDTLEYKFTHTPVLFSSSFCTGYYLFEILNKQQISSDTIEYSVKKVYYSFCMGAPFPTQGIDSFEFIVSNDSLLNHSNNLLGVYIYKPDSTEWDIVYFAYDTIAGLKHLSMALSGFEHSEGYEAQQNIGILNTSKSDADGGTTLYELSYANLDHYGLYGEYHEIVLDIAELPASSNLNIYFDEASKSLSICNNRSGLNQSEFAIYDVLGI